MASYINGLSNGRIVLVAVMDKGSYNLTENAKQAMESLGSAHIRDLAWRDSWAIIGVKAAPIGSVPEVHSPTPGGYAEVELRMPAVHLVEGFHFYATDQVNSTRRLSSNWQAGSADMEIDYYYPYGQINTLSREGTDYKFKCLFGSFNINLSGSPALYQKYHQ